MKKLVLFVAVFISITTFSYADTLQDEAKKYLKPIPSTPVEIQGNPSNPYKALLGKMLFFEPRISKSQTISCNSCHNAGAAFVDNQPRSIGHKWQMIDVNTPTALNAVFNIAQFWDGRSPDLADQARAPITETDEMAAEPEYVVAVMKSIPEYVILFQRAFPESKDDAVTFDNLVRAIEVFGVSLTTPNAPIDRFLKGDKRALNDDAKRGLEIFIAKDCVKCHNGINIGGGGFSNIEKYSKALADGAAADQRDFFTTERYEDNPLLIKIPSLRNIEWTAPYFRLGNEFSLKQAIRHSSIAKLTPELTDDEVESVYNFLLATTGNLPIITYPPLPKITESTPKATLD